MKHIFKRSLLIICSMFLLICFSGCSNNRQKLFNDVKYIRATSVGSYPSQLVPDMIIEENDERFKIILDILKKAELSAFEGEDTVIGGYSSLYIYDKDNYCIGKVNVNGFHFIPDDILEKEEYDENNIWDVSFYFDSYNGIYNFVNQEDEDAFIEAVYSLFKEAGAEI